MPGNPLTDPNWAPDLADTVCREALIMRRQVDHHLARARVAQQHLLVVVVAELDVPEIRCPLQVAVDVVGVESLRAERDNDTAAIGDGCAAGVRRLDMTRVDRRPFEGDAFRPSQSASLILPLTPTRWSVCLE